jgi:hypothetical protein
MAELPAPPVPSRPLTLAAPSLPAELHRLHELALENRRLREHLASFVLDLRTTLELAEFLRDLWPTAEPGSQAPPV